MKNIIIVQTLEPPRRTADNRILSKPSEQVDDDEDDDIILLLLCCKHIPTRKLAERFFFWGIR